MNNMNNMNTTNNTTTQFASVASVIESKELGLCAWAFSVQDGQVLLCAEGEVGVLLSPKDQASPKSPEEWKLLLWARGILSPVADTLGLMLAHIQKSKDAQVTLSDGEMQTIALSE